MKKLFYFTFCFFFLLPLASGEVIILNNGNTIQGVILDDKGKFYKVKVSTGVIYIKKSEVKKIDDGLSMKKPGEKEASGKNKKKYKLEHKFRKGQKWAYRVEVNSDGTIALRHGGKGRGFYEIQQFIDVKYKTSYEVEDVTSRGVGSIKMNIPWMDLNFRISGNQNLTFSFDTRSDKDIKKLQRHPELSVFQELARLKFFARVAPHGEVVNYRVKMDEKSVFYRDEQALQSFFDVYPQEPIFEGKKWKTSHIGLAGKIPMQLRIFYTVKKIEKYKGFQCARLRFRTRLNLLKGYMPSQLQALNISVNRSSGWGRAWIRLRDGKILWAEGTYTLGTDISVSRGRSTVRGNSKERITWTVKLEGLDKKKKK